MLRQQTDVLSLKVWILFFSITGTWLNELSGKVIWNLVPIIVTQPPVCVKQVELQEGNCYSVKVEAILK